MHIYGELVVVVVLLLPPPLHQNPISIEIHSFIDSELVSYKRTLSQKYNYEFNFRTLLVSSLDLINVYLS